MNNQHAGLSQALASQRITEQHQQAAHARLLRGRLPAASPPHQVGGPSLVAAGPLATHRHQPARPSPT